jgi:hypothetical protein
VHAEQIRKKFSRALREALVKQLGRLPPASYLSRHFNLRARGVGSVSQESARRWMRGLSVPSPDKLSVLATWLGLDIQEILSSPSDPSKPSPRMDGQSPANQPDPGGTWNSGNGAGSVAGESHEAATDLMHSLMDLLSAEERHLMLALMQRIAQSRGPQPDALPAPNGLDGGGGVNRRAAQWPPEPPA